MNGNLGNLNSIMGIAETYQYIEKLFRQQMRGLRESGDVQQRLIALVNYLCMLSYEISGEQLVRSARFAQVPLDNSYVREYITKAHRCGALMLKADDVVANVLDEPVYMEERWGNYVEAIGKLREVLFTTNNDESGNIDSDMKIARAECPKCGMFEISVGSGGEIVWVRYSKHPRYRTVCPQCGERIVSKLSRAEAQLFEELGVESRHHAVDLDESEIEEFVDNFESEIRTLLA